MQDVVEQLKALRSAAFERVAATQDYKLLTELDDMLARLDAGIELVAPSAEPASSKPNGATPDIEDAPSEEPDGDPVPDEMTVAEADATLDSDAEMTVEIADAETDNSGAAAMTAPTEAAQDVQADDSSETPAYTAEPEAETGVDVAGDVVTSKATEESAGKQEIVPDEVPAPEAEPAPVVEPDTTPDTLAETGPDSVPADTVAAEPETKVQTQVETPLPVETPTLTETEAEAVPAAIKDAVSDQSDQPAMAEPAVAEPDLESSIVQTIESTDDNAVKAAEPVSQPETEAAPITAEEPMLSESSEATPPPPQSDSAPEATALPEANAPTSATNVPGLSEEAAIRPMQEVLAEALGQQPNFETPPTAGAINDMAELSVTEDAAEETAAAALASVDSAEPIDNAAEQVAAAPVANQAGLTSGLDEALSETPVAPAAPQPAEVKRDAAENLDTSPASADQKPDKAYESALSRLNALIERASQRMKNDDVGTGS